MEPLLKGGQGKSDQEIEDSVLIVAVCLGLMLLIFVVAAL